MALPSYIQPIPNGFELRLKVVPNSSRSAVVGVLGDRLKIKVSAPPEAGKANAAVISLLRDFTGSKQIAIVAGTTSPEKTAHVLGLDPTAVRWPA